MNRKKRLILDLTTLYSSYGGNVVGVLRTEREIAVRLLSDTDIDIVPMIHHNGNFCAIDPSDAMELVTFVSTSASLNFRFPFLCRFIQTIQRVVVAGATFASKNVLYPLARACFRFVPTMARPDAKLAVFHINQTLRRSFRAPSTLDIDLSFVIYPNKDDTLLICGLGCDVNWKLLSQMKSEFGFQIFNIVYDLAPIKFPNFFPGDPSDYCYNYFLHVADLCDHVFCISRCTETDFKDFCEKEGRVAPRTSVLYLGANLPAVADSGDICEPDTEKLKASHYALSVGTIEIRKNHRLLLDVWEDLAKEDPQFDLDLVLVGMRGWGSDHVLRRLRSSPLLRKRVFWFERLSDGGLSWLYHNCQVFVFPSLYEGWGLPIVEALLHGKPVIVSDRGASPEAGLGLAEIVSVDDLTAWKDAIRRQGKQGASNYLFDVSRVPTWENTVAHVKEMVLEAS